MSSIVNVTQNGASVPERWKIKEERLGRQARAQQADGARRTGQKSGVDPQNGQSAPNMDRYVHEKEHVSAGVYQKGRDENGTPMIVPGESQRDPAPAEDVPAGKTPKGSDKAGGGKEKVTNVNTDKVDAEIRKLQKKKAELEKQIERAADDPQKQDKLRKQLDQVNSELDMKNNDTYRRQHAEVTSL